MDPNPVHIFAYGSLMWRPGFVPQQTMRARATGWVRRLWQGSPDHRGTPELMGCVASLLPRTQGECWGLVHAVDAGHAPTVLAQIDERERGGYRRCTVQVLLDGGTALACVCWVAHENNPCFLGAWSEVEVARRVSTARGPSGSNRDYVLALQAALLEWGQRDPHVDQVVSRLDPAG